MVLLICFIFSEPATPEIYTYCPTLSLHAVLPIYPRHPHRAFGRGQAGDVAQRGADDLVDAQVRRERREGVLKHDLGGAAKIAFLPPVHRRDIDAIEADHAPREFLQPECGAAERRLARTAGADERDDLRSEEHTSELQSLMRTSY